MRESIGAVSLINFVIFFILLVFAFLMGTFSYYKAYRVNNAMVSAIEKYEGFNSLSYEEMEQKLSSFGYNKVKFNCPTSRASKELGQEGILLGYDSSSGSAHIVDEDHPKGYEGYCIYVYNNDTPSSERKLSDIYDSYEVTTVITFQFPIIQNILKMRVSSKTSNIYNFEASQKCIDEMNAGHAENCDADYYKN